MRAQARDPGLEAAIASQPELVDNYLVYADWLAARGHPRGELIAVQQRLSLAPDDAELQARHAQLLDEHRKALGCEGGPGIAGFEVDWHLGFWRAVRIELDGDAESSAGVEAVLGHPSAALLESLTIHGANLSTGEVFRAIAQRLSEPELPIARTLRRLALGSRAVPLRWSPAALEHSLPRLEQLELRSSFVHHSYLDWQLPRLRSFTLVTRALGHRRLARLCRSLPAQLIALTLDVQGDKLRADDVESILDGSLCPALTRLGLLGFVGNVELAEALLRSPLLPQLREIGLRPPYGWWHEDELPTRLQDPALADKRLFCSDDLSAAERYNFGLMLRTDLRRPAEALAAFEQALRDAPDDATTWMEHGNALEDLGELPKAERSYREALRLDPKLGSVWHNLAVCLKRQQRFAEALEAFRSSSTEAEPLASTLHCIGHMHQALGEHDEGRRVLQQAIDGYTEMLDDDPFDAEVLYWRGAASARLRRRSEALADLRRAIDLDEHWRDAARSEEDFIELREDAEFQALTDSTLGPALGPR